MGNQETCKFGIANTAAVDGKVAKQFRDANGDPLLLEMKAEWKRRFNDEQVQTPKSPK